MEPAEEAQRGKAGPTPTSWGPQRSFSQPDPHPQALELQNHSRITHVEVRGQGRKLQLIDHMTTLKI